MEPSFVLVSGTSHEELAREIASHLKTPLGKVQVQAFLDGEIGVEVFENVRDKDVFIIQAPGRRPNHFLMELLILVDALKRASSRKITAVVPYYPYARQDRRGQGQGPITAKLVADLLEKVGVSHLLTMDLHTEQIQGFFNIPVDPLQGRRVLAKELKKRDLSLSVIVSPDIGSNKMARKYAEELKLDIAMIDKRRLSPNEVVAGPVIGGPIQGRQAILVDDICSSGSTLEIAALSCKKEGATRVIAAVTHDLQTRGMPRGVDEMIVTNTLPRTFSSEEGKKVVSVAEMFSEAIGCMVKGHSLSGLFK